MPIIIDGWNLIRDEDSHINDDDTDSLEAAEKLVSYLDEFQHTHNDPIIISLTVRMNTWISITKTPQS